MSSSTHIIAFPAPTVRRSSVSSPARSASASSDASTLNAQPRRRKKTVSSVEKELKPAPRRSVSASRKACEKRSTSMPATFQASVKRRSAKSNKAAADAFSHSASGDAFCAASKRSQATGASPRKRVSGKTLSFASFVQACDTANDYLEAKFQRLVSSFLSLMMAALRSRATVCAAVVILSVFVSCVVLYTPARQYYESVRDQARIEAEYEALLLRNDALEEGVEDLQSESGLKQEAHEVFGLVEEGQSSGKVSGLDLDESDADSDMPQSVLSGSVAAPRTWYSDIGDFIFGYDANPQ